MAKGSINIQAGDANLTSYYNIHWAFDIAFVQTKCMFTIVERIGNLVRNFKVP
jgi:hypothetical protein